MVHLSLKCTRSSHPLPRGSFFFCVGVTAAEESLAAQVRAAAVLDTFLGETRITSHSRCFRRDAERCSTSARSTRAFPVHLRACLLEDFVFLSKSNSTMVSFTFTMLHPASVTSHSRRINFLISCFWSR